MPEATATNPQTGEKIVFRNGQWVPMGAPAAAPVPIVGGPVFGAPPRVDPPTPIQVEANEREVFVTGHRNRAVAVDGS